MAAQVQRDAPIWFVVSAGEVARNRVAIARAGRPGVWAPIPIALPAMGQDSTNARIVTGQEAVLSVPARVGRRAGGVWAQGDTESHETRRVAAAP